MYVNVGFYGYIGTVKTTLNIENPSKIRQDEEKKMPAQKICTGKNVTIM